MKNAIIKGVIVVVAWLLVPQTARSQGTLYVSSLDLPSAGSVTVASDSWIGEGFNTGNNPSGYILDSIELDMTSATGDPSGFTVQLYTSQSINGGYYPGSSIATLTGSSDPATAGLYTYIDSGLTMSSSTLYFIVLTSETPIASGTYALSYETTSPANSTGGFAEGILCESSAGTSWGSATPGGGIAQMELTATAVPEPAPLILMGLPGVLFFAWRRWRARAQAS